MSWFYDADHSHGFFSGRSSHSSQLLWRSGLRRDTDVALLVLSKGGFIKVLQEFFRLILFLIVYYLLSYYSLCHKYADDKSILSTHLDTRHCWIAS